MHRLVALGARRAQRLEADGINGVGIVMQDPRATSSASTEWGAGQLTALNRSGRPTAGRPPGR
jgi:hypothetical protein